MTGRGPRCDRCDCSWPGTATWCGRCGERLHVHRLRRLPSLRPPAWTAAALIGLLVAVAAGALVLSRDRVPAADSDVDLAATTSSSTAPAMPPAAAEVPTIAAPRCRTTDRDVDCVTWSVDLALDDRVLPAAASGRVLASTGVELVAVRTADGQLDWRAPLSDLVWIYSAAESDRHVLAVDLDQRIHVVDATTGDVTTSFENVRPVLPGVVDGRLAILRGGITEVIDVTTGAVVASAPRDSRFPSGRLVPGARFLSWQATTVTVHDLRGREEDWTLEVPAEPTDVVGTPRTAMLTLGDASLVAIDLATRSVRWQSPPAFADRLRTVVTDDAVLTAIGLGGTDAVRVLDVDDGTVRRQLEIDRLVELHRLPNEELLVIHRAGRRLDLLVLAARGQVPGDRTVSLDGAGQPFVVTGGRVVASGDRGAALVDLVNGNLEWVFGAGAAAAVATRSPVVLDDGVLHRIDAPRLP